jgi:hypothetical protein
MPWRETPLLHSDTMLLGRITFVANPLVLRVFKMSIHHVAIPVYLG